MELFCEDFNAMERSSGRIILELNPKGEGHGSLENRSGNDILGQAAIRTMERFSECGLPLV
jgi:hypothetical protein